MPINLTIDPDANPTTMRELKNKLREVRAAVDIIGAKNYCLDEDMKLTGPLLTRASELEVMAADIEIKTLDDLVAAFDVFRAMRAEIDCDYGDRRDANLIDAMRRAVVHIMGRREAFGPIEPGPAPTKVQPIASSLAIDCADKIDAVLHSLALAMEALEQRCRMAPSEQDRAAVNGLASLLFEQADKLRAIREKLLSKAGKAA